MFINSNSLKFSLIVFFLFGYANADIPANKFEEKDIFELNFEYTPKGQLHKQEINTAALKACSENNAICASIPSKPSAWFATGLLGQAFIVPEVPFVVRLDFKEDIPTDTHLAQVYNELGNGEVAGRIIQLDATSSYRKNNIDYSGCDTLIKNGKTSGQSCFIKGVYQGMAMNNTENQIHMVFSSLRNSSFSLNFSFPVQNKNPASELLPILTTFTNFDGLAVLHHGISEANSGVKLDISREFLNDLPILNIGSSDLLSNGTSSVHVSLASGFDSVYDGLARYGYTSDDRQTTNCYDLYYRQEASDLSSICYPGFYYASKYDTPGVNFGRIILNYNNGYQDINYTKRFVFSSGSINPKDYIVDDPYDSVIQIEIGNYASDSLAYSDVLSNVEFKAVYNPKFNVPSYNASDTRLEYFYGDSLGKGIDISNAMNDIKFKFDEGCFSSTPATQADFGSRSCKLKLDLSSIPGYNYLKNNLSFSLYIKYKSSARGLDINQYIGTVDVLPVTFIKNPVIFDNRHKFIYGIMPPIKSNGTLGDIKNKRGVITANMLYARPFVTQLNFVDTCDLDKGINVLSYIEPGKVNVLSFLKCESLSNKFPPGDYQNMCLNPQINGNLLQATCFGKTIVKGYSAPQQILHVSSIDIKSCKSNQEIGVDEQSASLICKNRLASNRRGLTKSVNATTSPVSSSHPPIGGTRPSPWGNQLQKFKAFSAKWMK